MAFGKSAYYLVFPAVFGIVALTLIPKRLYKKFFIYGLLFGGVFNVAVILVVGRLFHAFQYLQLGPFGIWGLFPIFIPVTWVFVFMIYLYFLPVRKAFFYPYLISFIGFAYIYGAFMKGLGLFRFYGIYQYLEPITFIVWFSLAAWVYMRSERIRLK